MRALALGLLLTACTHRVDAELSHLAGTEFILARLTVAPDAPVKVHLTVPRGFLPPGRSTVVLTFFSMSPEFVTRQLREQVGGKRQPLAVERVFDGSGDLELDYELVLPMSETQTHEGLVTSSFVSGQSVHLTGSNVLPFLSLKNGEPLRRPGAVIVDSPGRVVSSLPREGDRFVVDDWTKLRAATFQTGSFSEVLSPLGTRFVSPDLEPRHLEHLARLESRAEPLLNGWLGSRQRLRLVTTHRVPDPSGFFFDGMQWEESIVTRGPNHPSDVVWDRPNLVLLHELVHAHLPPAPGLPPWIVEGVTDYFALRAAMTLAQLPEARIRPAVERAHDRLSRYQSGQSVPYQAGLVLGYCIDVRLRHDGTTLASVLTRANVRAGGRAIANSYWEEEIALASAAAGALVLNAKTDPVLDPADCFVEAGLPESPPLTLEERQVAKRRAGAWLGSLLSGHMLGLVYADLEPGKPQAPWRDGDLLLTVDGHAVDTLREVTRAVAGAKPGPITVEVVRAGDRVHLSVP
ncbi:MAG: hypothetical protein K1X89_22510 [Myxococcaceae bacterium]|nr:hypothetical protein [Myxococcaceae bacterium]